VRSSVLMVSMVVLVSCGGDTGTDASLAIVPEVPARTWQRPGSAAPSTQPIPDKNVVDIAVGDDAQSIVDLHPAGTVFMFGPGIHYETEIVAKDGDVFLATPAAVLSGARLVTSFLKVEGFWVAGGFDQEGEQRGSCTDERPSCVFPEDLFVDDRPLVQVMDRDDLVAGSWYFDTEADSIYLFDDPAGRKVEMSVIPYAFYGSARQVTLRGLVLEKYANPAQRGAIGAEGTGPDWLLVGNEVRLVHGTGIKAGPGSRVIDNYLHHNGQLGLSGSGDGILVEGNELSYNNVGGFNPYWGGGGAKFVSTTDLQVIGNYAHHNLGPGLWTDIDNIGTLYEGNLVVANLHAGIKHEISYDAQIVDNWVEANGYGNPNSIAGAGIFVSSSPNVEIWGNTVLDNRHGIGALSRDRGVGKYGPYELRGLYVHDNEVTMTDGYSGVMSVDGNEAFTEWNNRFESNHYVLNGDADAFQWRGAARNFVEWNDYGLDLDGSIG